MSRTKRGGRGSGAVAAAARAAPPALVESILETVADFSYLTMSELLDELPELGGDLDLTAPGHRTVLCRGLSPDGLAALTALLTTNRIRLERGTVRAGKGV